MYSLSISCRAVWNSLKDVLIDPAKKDRSWEVITQASFELSDDLRVALCDHLDQHGMGWLFWANTILNALAHLRKAMENHPSQHLFHLFCAKEGPRYCAIRRELKVDHSVNDSFHEEITSLRRAFDVHTGIELWSFEAVASWKPDWKLRRLETNSVKPSSVLRSNLLMFEKSTRISFWWKRLLCMYIMACPLGLHTKTRNSGFKNKISFTDELFTLYSISTGTQDSLIIKWYLILFFILFYFIDS